MKKVVLTISAIGLLVSSCGTYTGQGAVVGGSFGAVLGSAIGGVAGGWRGSDIGTIVGMASGAAIGASVGAAADQQEAEKYEQYRRERDARRAQRDYGYQQNDRMDQSGYDATNSGDDRIDFDAPGPRGGSAAPTPRGGGYTAAVPQTYDPVPSRIEPGYSIKYNSLIEIRNARFIDADHDGVIRRGEECRVTFEIMNRSSMTLYDVQPMVFETSGNKHIHISPNLHVESIAPNSGVRYTATVLADKKLKDGQVVIRVAVAQGNREITSQVKEFTVMTSKH